jgi:hypothetical protein
MRTTHIRFLEKGDAPLQNPTSRRLQGGARRIDRGRRAAGEEVIPGPIKKVGFVGIGNTGWPMAANLLRARFDVRIEQRPERPHEAKGGALPLLSDALEEVADLRLERKTRRCAMFAIGTKRTRKPVLMNARFEGNIGHDVDVT